MTIVSDIIYNLYRYNSFSKWLKHNYGSVILIFIYLLLLCFAIISFVNDTKNKGINDYLNKKYEVSKIEINKDSNDTTYYFKLKE